MDERIQQILDYWFNSPNQQQLWWGKNPDTDADIKHQFNGLIETASDAGLQDWLPDPHGRLAVIILLDQFRRNIYRDTPAAFAKDDLALKYSLDGIEKQFDQTLEPMQRVFFYMPLEHAEDKSHQAHCVALMRQLAESVSPEQRATFTGFVDYALAHQRIIDQFDRFPHRNTILGRESSAEELAFLKQPNSSF